MKQNMVGKSRKDRGLNRAESKQQADMPQQPARRNFQFNPQNRGRGGGRGQFAGAPPPAGQGQFQHRRRGEPQRRAKDSVLSLSASRSSS